MSRLIDRLGRAAAGSPLSRREALKLGGATATLLLAGRGLTARAYAEGDGDCGCPSCGGPGGAYCLAPDKLDGYQVCAGGAGAPGQFYCQAGYDCCSSSLANSPCCVPGYECMAGAICCEPGMVGCISQTANGDGSYSGTCCPPGSVCTPEGTCATAAPPTARLRVAPAVTRGGTVTLDASASRAAPGAAITNYTFTFAPGPDCPPGLVLDTTQKNSGGAAITQVKVVCSLSVTVTVTDDHGLTATSAPQKAVVRARRLRPIPFRQSAEDHVTLPFFKGALAFGLNRSAAVWKDSDRDPDAADRWLDPGPDPKGLKESVQIAQVDDEHGPFDQFWYVVGHKLKIERVIIINRKLLRGGSVYDDNRRHRQSLAALVGATRAHERLHGQLAHAALLKQGASWLRRLEQTIAADLDGLLIATDAIIREAESDLKEAASEDKVHGRMDRLYGKRRVSIEVPTSGADSLETFRLAALGDL